LIKNSHNQNVLPAQGTLATEIDAIVGGYHGAPHTVLGSHEINLQDQTATVVRVFRPLDHTVWLLNSTDGERYEMALIHEGGFFEIIFRDLTLQHNYHLAVQDQEGNEYELEDPYRFSPLLTTYDLHLHNEGNFQQSYTKLGAQPRNIEGVAGINFAVWAPNAQRVSVIGPFNGWDNRTHAMHCHEGYGIWEIFIPNLPEGMDYKYSVRSTQLGYEIDKADPYAFYADLRPSTSSRIWHLDSYEWQDQAWLASRAQRQKLDQPINIYEVHLGSWRRVPEDQGFLNYRDLAHQLAAYAQEMGYTHIELLPITEYPFDGSWGYQVTGYFAPTSRHGTPDDFMYFVDYCHQHNIGVILDWVPAHFPKDAHGLAFFDGTHLYEHADPSQGEHQDWGTKIFNFGRNEVRNFLISSALFWLDKYHLDGLRVDAVASMLYLDYSRNAESWTPNRYGGRENLEAIDFIRRFNELTHATHPGILTIAEESTSWPLVTRPVHIGGLGFDIKWNMGWMHDMLDYIEKDPIHRRYHHSRITFSLMYAFTENFMLPFSHDEVVHLKGAMLDKMPGDLWQKFANLRALYAYMAGHPGKKLLFMGSEFGQWREWSEERSLDWHLLETTEHRQLQKFVADLNRHYLQEEALHQVDDSWDGFAWIDTSDADQSVISFARRSRQQDELIVAICNFTPVPRLGYRVGLPDLAQYTELINSDWTQYGGSGVQNGAIMAEETPWQSCAFSAPVNLPPLGVILFKAQARGNDSSF